ncbi:MAG: prephenate dehydratase [Syntrophobacterales bacterium]|nr:prephenate dehydratase [Syntrophobacterales bacterium]
MSEELERLRRLIDEVDMKILENLSQRMRLSKAIGEIKRREGLPLFDIHREEALLRKLIISNREPILKPAFLQAIYREIFAASRSIQYTISVAYLGPEWTYAHVAARFMFGSQVEYKPFPTLSDVFDAVSRNLCSIAVVPIENSLEGSIGVTMDFLFDYDLSIIRESYMAMEYVLAVSDPSSSQITEVYAHPRAMNQCRRWLAEHVGSVNYVECASTAEAAKRCKDNPLPGRAALCNLFAAHHYGLSVVAQNIADYPGAVTRFIALGRAKTEPTGNDKTSIVFASYHSPGMLHKALQPFAEHGVNLSRIESRPNRRLPSHYLFFVDLDGHQENEAVKRSLKEMEKVVSILKILGSYPKASMENPLRVCEEMARHESKSPFEHGTEREPK